MSEHEKKKQRELAARVRQDKINQEELKRDAEELIATLKVCNSNL